MIPPKLIARAEEYLNRRQLLLKGYLGGGTDGEVWQTSNSTAIKVFRALRGYGNESASYEILSRVGITDKIDGFWVPRMVDSDDELMIVEMDIIQEPPYILDFAKVMLYRSPDFSPEQMAENDRSGRFLFEHRWDEVVSLMATLEDFGIYYLDPRRGNISFPDMP